MNVRAKVFYNPSDTYCGRGWTWCLEFDGEPDDLAWKLPAAKSTWKEAYRDACTALRRRSSPTPVGFRREVDP